MFGVFISVRKASTDLLLLHLWFLLFREGSNKSHTRSSLNLLRRDTWDHGTMAGECRRLARWRKEMCESKQKPWDQSWMVDQAEPVIWLNCMQTDQHPSVCAHTRTIQPLEWGGIEGDSIPRTLNAHMRLGRQWPAQCQRSVSFGSDLHLLAHHLFRLGHHDGFMVVPCSDSCLTCSWMLERWRGSWSPDVSSVDCCCAVRKGFHGQMLTQIKSVLKVVYRAL